MVYQHFKQVSLDIKGLILSYITRPTDLKSLCLTCKELRDIATPLLYRRVILCVGGHQDIRLSAFLGRDNPGINHIREIYLRLEKIPVLRKHNYHSDDSTDEEELEEAISIPARQAQFTVRLLLDFLPSNILEVFSWQNWEPLSTENFLLLCKKQQQSLREIEVGPLDQPLLPRLEKAPNIFQLPKLRSADIYPDTLDRLKVCQMLLKRKPNLEHVCIASGFEYSNEDPEDLHDSSTQPGLLSRTLFSHMLPFERSCDPMRLKYLDMDTIKLRYAADTWLKVVKFSCLERLEIRNCAGADAVFTQLSKPHLRPTKLQSLRWVDDITSEPYALQAFEGLLEALSGLKTLHVEVNNMQTMPKVATITHHRKTLTSLSVHSQLSHIIMHHYVEEDFNKICTECTELRELSIMFPKTTVEHAVPNPDFEAYLASTRKLQYLMTLVIGRWPSTRESFIGSYHKLIVHALKLYEHQLQRITQRIFETNDAYAKENNFGLGTRSRLAVVCWGGNGRTRYEGSEKFKLRQIPFVRGLKVDPFGQSSLLAVQTVWKMVQFVEPCSQILNHSLYDLHDVQHGP